MRIIDRYVLKIFLAALAAILAFMLGLFVLLHALLHLKDLERTESSLAAAGYGVFEGFARYYALHLPEILVLLGPYALLFAAAYALHHLGQGHELDSLHAVGVGRFRVCLPIFAFAMLASVGLVALREDVVPRTAGAMDRISAAVRGKDADDPRVSLWDGRGNWFYARLWNSSERRLEDVWMDGPRTGGTIHFPALTFDESRDRFIAEGPSAPVFAEFSDLRLVDVPKEQTQVRRMSHRELREELRRRRGSDEVATRMHERVAFAFAPLVLLLAGLPVVLSSRRRNVFARAGWCLVLALGFFATTQLTQRMGTQGALSPLLAAWLPILIFGLGGVVLFRAGERA